MKPILLLSALLLFSFLNELSAQWEIKHLDENDSYFQGTIKFKNDSLGIFMGNNSVILKSIDAGETWNAINLSTHLNLNDFQFTGESVIYAVGDQVLIKSADQGETWDSIAGFKGKRLVSLWFFNNDSGMVAGYDGIYRTVDAGNTWDTVWNMTGSGYQYGALDQVFFTDNKIGYAIGEGRTQSNGDHFFDDFLLQSSNSGRTWDTICLFQQGLSSIYFLNRDTGYIGTDEGGILKTGDAGHTWRFTQLIPSYKVMDVKSLQFLSKDLGYSAGSPRARIPEASTRFFISRTTDGGETWDTWDTTGIPLHDIFFIDDTIGFVAGSFNLIMKSNGIINKLPEDYPWHLSVGTKDHIFGQAVTEAFPNPVTGFLTIRSKNAGDPVKDLVIISVSGQVLKHFNIENTSEDNSLDCSSLAPGLYLLQVSFKDHVEVVKVFRK